MDILIKSFNRPYYLDRCLFSIEKHVKHFDGKIMLLDDGTPQIYLDKIATKYPKVIIKKSSFYDTKQDFTLKGEKPQTYFIPLNLWVEAAKNASDNFILIEDDTWFIEDVDLEQLNIEITQNNVVLTKLFWIGNAKINQSKSTIVKDDLVLLEPKLFTTIPALYYFIFYKFDKFKIRKILRLLKINTLEKQLAYYTIYAVAGVVINRQYFIDLCNNHQNKIDEGLQIFNAVKILNNQKQKIKFAHYKREILKTGFMSSATNQYKEDYEGNVDMFVFNKILNQAWFDNKFDVIQSLPNDLDFNEIITVINNDLEQRVSAQNWINWTSSFKQQYLKIGCIIE